MVRDRRFAGVEELKAEAILVREFDAKSGEQTGQRDASYMRFHCNALEVVDSLGQQAMWCRIEDVETYGRSELCGRFCLPSPENLVKIVDLRFSNGEEAGRFVSTLTAQMQAFVEEKKSSSSHARLQLCSDELREACRELCNRF